MSVSSLQGQELVDDAVDLVEVGRKPFLREFGRLHAAEAAHEERDFLRAGILGGQGVGIFRLCFRLGVGIRRRRRAEWCPAARGSSAASPAALRARAVAPTISGQQR